jgi:predicted ATPase/DNA-binding winged helix-turn-helix (wHTH) protein
MNTLANLDEPSPTPTETVFEFGSYRLHDKQRMLSKGKRRVPLAGRPLSILIALVERLGEVVSNRELEARLWSNSYVSDGTLRVHITALQKILGLTENGTRFIENLARRGYRMTVPVRRCVAEIPAIETQDQVISPLPVSSSTTSHTLQPRLVGRAECVARIVAILREHPLITLTGPGGIGKTTVAVEVARQMLADYPDGIWVVDLAAIAAASDVVGTVAATLGIVPLQTDPLAAVLAFLKERVSLLVLDNCEHVLDEAAQLAQTVVRTALRVRVLATSREHLHAEGEWVHRLAPLEVPTQPSPWTRDQLLSASAITLFTVRAAAVADIQFSDEQLSGVAELCRRLSGNPLAIEIAAARLDLLGLPGLIAALDAGHWLSLVGHRTRVARHWTLRATLDWSYDLLTPLEQTLFRRLGVFCDSFDLAAAAAIMSEDGSPKTDVVFQVLLSLTSKSMLAHEHTGNQIRYRLHETSRIYAFGRLRDRGELALIRRRHALMWCHSGTEAISLQLPEGVGWPTVFGCHVEDLRAAIHWYPLPSPAGARKCRAPLDVCGFIWAGAHSLAEFRRSRP